MKVKVTFEKRFDKVRASIIIMDAVGYCTDRLFYDEESDQYYDYVREDFELNREGLQQAQKWTDEVVDCVRKKVLAWRNFELPPDKEIEI